MELPESVIQLILNFTARFPQYTHVAMFSDTWGGFEWFYCKDKAAAEKRTAGQKNTEVIAITE
jgi:hypothetical protein